MDSAACSVNIPRVLKTRAPVEADLVPADRELLAGRKVVVVMPAYWEMTRKVSLAQSW